jgi:hypothetical protein
MRCPGGRGRGIGMEMSARWWTPLVVVVVLLAGGVSAQEASHEELSRDLARLMLDESARRGLEEQVTTVMVQAIATTIQDRLSRRLQDAEWRMLGDIVTRFVGETFPPSRTEDIAARAYAHHFDDAELRELLRFQRSDVGRKAERLAGVIRSETARAIDGEIRESPSMPRLLDDLQHAFPVLRLHESP